MLDMFLFLVCLVMNYFYFLVIETTTTVAPTTSGLPSTSSTAEPEVTTSGKQTTPVGTTTTQGAGTTTEAAVTTTGTPETTTTTPMVTEPPSTTKQIVTTTTVAQGTTPGKACEEKMDNPSAITNSMISFKPEPTEGDTGDLRPSGNGIKFPKASEPSITITFGEVTSIDQVDLSSSNVALVKIEYVGEGPRAENFTPLRPENSFDATQPIMIVPPIQAYAIRITLLETTDDKEFDVTLGVHACIEGKDKYTLYHYCNPWVPMLYYA